MVNPFESPSAEEHRRNSPDCIRCAVVTVSDSRTLEQDFSGRTMVELLESEGHQVIERTIVPDEPTILTELVQRFSQSSDIDAVLFTGGTGIAARDQTTDAIASLLTKELPGYGELLRMLSYQEIGAAAMLSRAIGGIVDQTVVLTMPGSTAAVRLAMHKLILPELKHMVSLAGR